MSYTSRFYLRLIVPVLALGWGLGASPEPASAAKRAEQSHEMVQVDVELQQPDADALDARRLVAWNVDTTLGLESDGHRHAVTVNVRKVSSRKLEVRVAYARDGSTVMEPVVVDAKAKKRHVVRSADGGVTIALLLAPRKVTTDEAREEGGHVKIEHPDSDDPLGGVE